MPSTYCMLMACFSPIFNMTSFVRCSRSNDKVTFAVATTLSPLQGYFIQHVFTINDDVATTMTSESDVTSWCIIVHVTVLSSVRPRSYRRQGWWRQWSSTGRPVGWKADWPRCQADDTPHTWHVAELIDTIRLWLPSASRRHWRRKDVMTSDLDIAVNKRRDIVTEKLMIQRRWTKPSLQQRKQKKR